MARTPLLRTLSRMLSTAAAAERAGVPVDELRERAARRSAGITRRELLVGGAAAAATTLVLPRTAYGGKRPSVVIVGAGMAGLSCALRLQDKDVPATVYEASGRIGGRMFSENSGYWDHGQVTEWCGELIDTGHTAIQKLAGRFNLPLDGVVAAEPGGTTDTFYFDGGYYPAGTAVTDFDAMRRALRDDLKAAGYPTTWDSATVAGTALDQMSVRDWINSRVPGGVRSPLGQLLDVAYTIEYAAETTDQSALNLVYLLGYSDKNFQIFGESDEALHIRGGNQRLCEAMAESLAIDVVTGHRLVAIAQRNGGDYRLTFEHGKGTVEVVADLVVLTLPFAVLRGLDCRKAGFDALKQTAIRDLGRGRSGKLQLQFSSRSWNAPGPWGAGGGNGASYSDTGYQSTWEPTRGQAGRAGVLNDFTGGDTTAALHTSVPYARAGTNAVDRDARDFLSRVNPVFPGLGDRWNGKATSSLPHLSSFAQLSYSYWRVGQYTGFAGYEGVRQGNVFFAGEHTSTDFQGFMEGAAREGKRAANEILAQLRIP